jgi:hypothetical protein
MISAWWLIPAVMVGAVFGLLAEALCVMASENDERGGK